MPHPFNFNVSSVEISTITWNYDFFCSNEAVRMTDMSSPSSNISHDDANSGFKMRKQQKIRRKKIKKVY
jgi:hypothetical protein